MTASRRPAAFTLVELLVVIGIIAILIAILLPTISRAKEQANTTACAANLRSLGQLFQVYTVEFKGFYPYGYYRTNAPGGGGASAAGDSGSTAADRTVFTWWTLTRKFMKNGKFSNWDNFVDFQAERFMAAFNCPTGLRRDAGNDFGANQLVMPEIMNERSQISIQPERALLAPARTKQVKPDVILLWDATEIPPNWNSQYVVGYNVDNGIHRIVGTGSAGGTLRFFRGQAPSGDPAVSDEGLVPAGPDTDGSGSYWEGNIRWRHQRGKAANFLFADGSVRTLGKTKHQNPGDWENSPAVSGELVRRMLRPTAPTGFRPAI